MKITLNRNIIENMKMWEKTSLEEQKNRGK